MDRRDLPGLALVAVSLLIGLAANWECFGDLLIDCGREMNQPLRLLHGERLYADVQHLYGPFSPHLHALLYRVFGVHLDVLRASGAVTAVVVVALVYWIGRRLAGRRGALTAALGATWLCALQPNGNFVLPYSYSAVHGSALALGALALGVGFLERRRLALLALCGLCAGLACTAKLEMGVAALVGGAAAALLGGPLQLRPLLRRALAFGVPAVAVPAVVYAALAARVGIGVLARDSFLLLRLPDPVVFFLRSSYGLDHPWRALAREATALVALAALAAGIGVAALGLARRGPGGARGVALRHGPWVLLLSALVLMRQRALEIDPMAALPLVLAIVVVLTLARAVRQWRSRSRPAPRTSLVLACGVFALACLGRALLSVGTNSYGSYMLPAALTVLAWLWTWRLPALLRRASAVRWAGRLGVVTFLAWTVGAGVLTVQRAASARDYPVATSRGTLRAGPGRGPVFAEAIRFIERETRPGDAVAVLPEGTSLLFLTDRRNPLNEEAAVPGLLNEARAIRQLESSGTRLVLITDRPTDEYGAMAFGRDYDRRTMEWILARFRLCAIFGRDARPDRQIGPGRFFIKAYCLRPAAS